MNDDMPEKGVTLSPSQSVQLMALGVMLKNGEITFRCEDSDLATDALNLVLDVSQEIALALNLPDVHKRVVASAENVSSLASARFHKRQDPAVHDARSALVVATEWYDSLPEGQKCDHAIVIFGRNTEDGGSGTRFFQAGNFRHHGQMGLCMEGQHMIRESGRHQ